MAALKVAIDALSWVVMFPGALKLAWTLRGHPPSSASKFVNVSRGCSYGVGARWQWTANNCVSEPHSRQAGRVKRGRTSGRDRHVACLSCVPPRRRCLVRWWLGLSWFGWQVFSVMAVVYPLYNFGVDCPLYLRRYAADQVLSRCFQMPYGGRVENGGGVKGGMRGG